MAKPIISDQISNVEYAISEYPEYKDILTFHQSILNIRKPIDMLPAKGTNLNLDDLVGTFQQQISSKKPVVNFFEASMFDPSSSLDVCKKATLVLMNQGVVRKNLKAFYKILESHGIDILDFLNAILKENSKWFTKNGRRFRIEPSTLFFIFSIPLQPVLEEVSRRLEHSFLNQWWQPTCPICGRKPSIAWLKGGKRYLTCVFCGSEYLADLFLCVNCGNVDPYSLGFYRFNFNGFQIDFCEKCKHYIKVIDQNKLNSRIPRGLEDFLTQSLDEIAIKAGLSRI